MPIRARLSHQSLLAVRAAAPAAAPPADSSSSPSAAAAADASSPAATADASPHGQKHRVSVVALGCPKNMTDAETMLGDLQRLGFEVVGDDHASADAIVVNTCAFIEDSKNESLEAVMAAAGLGEEDGRKRKVIVSGCLAQRYGDQLAEAMPEADLIIGFEHYDSLGASLGALLDRQRAEGQQKEQEGGKAPSKKKTTKKASAKAKAAGIAAAIGLVEGENDGPTSSAAVLPALPRRVQVGSATVPFRSEAERYRLGPKHTAYLRVAEGCDQACSFCAIPGFRGKFRSKPYAALLDEARALVASGAKEINLIAEDVNFYGNDRKDGKTLTTLLRDLEQIQGLDWVRLLYCYPSLWTDELVDEIARNPKVCKYIDIPLQHSDNLVLLAMNRPPAAHTGKILDKLRARIPDLALRTTFICGFPGETPEQHRALLDYVRDMRFERMGAFAYSEEEGTVAATMEGQVPVKERQRRRDALVAAQHAIQCERAEALVGREVDVLVDGINEDGWVVGRTQWDAPDVDPCVFVAEPEEGSGIAPSQPGEIRRCRVTSASLFDLEAVPIA
jgi:ribosomal protein S12 methylthiotransferase